MSIPTCVLCQICEKGDAETSKLETVIVSRSSGLGIPERSESFLRNGHWFWNLSRLGQHGSCGENC